MKAGNDPELLLESLRRQERELEAARQELREKERAFSTLIGNLDGMVYRCRDDEHWTMEFVSSGCAALTGYAPQELILNSRISYEDLTHPEDRSRVRAEIGAALRTRRRFYLEYRIVSRGGAVKWVWEAGVGIHDDYGKLVAIEGFIQDVSQHKQSEHALRQAEERYRGIFENAIEGIFQSTVDGHYLRANPALARIYGYESPNELVGGLSDIGRQLYVDSNRRREFALLMEREGSVKNFVSQVRRRDGSIIWISENARTVRDEEGRIAFYEGTVEDITESKRYQERLEHQATHDALTTLPNRLLLSDRLRQAVEYAKRYRQMVAVLFVDLDNFKLINDSLGHEAGDRLLKAMAQRMRECVRGSDTVARQAGDEFVVLLRNERSEEDVRQAVGRVVRAVCAPWRDEGQDINISCSVGISLYPRDGEDAAALLKNADAAMYRAKEQGRNQYQFFTSDISAAARQKLELQNRLLSGFEQSEFVLHYQPKIDLRRGAVTGMEALLRWQPEGMPMVGPDVFIPVAEECGLILALGEWVMQEACRYVGRLHALGHTELQVAVNLSARQFYRRDLVANVERVLRETGVEPRCLELELTESMMMHDTEHFVATLEALDRLGVRLAVDDFGTGYSNLVYLKRFPVSRLKVDRAFVRNVGSDPDDAAIVKAVISLAHNLGLRVVAEGVETAAQLDFLAAHGCDEIQGYYFSRPLPAAEFEAFLHRPLAQLPSGG